MFIANKYYNLYMQIVNKRRLDVLVENYERHHIIPKCLGGSNDDSNLVNLSFREHYVCHKLLTKCMVDSIKAKRMFAAMCMTRSVKTNRIVDSRTYEFYRKEGIKAMIGTSHTQHTRAAISKSLQGKRHSQERKAKISNTLKGRFAGCKNSNAKTWLVENIITGESFTCTGSIHEECSLRNISSYLLMEYYRKGRQPATKGRTAGWRITSLL